MIDGKADAREGMFRQLDVENGTPRQPGVEWKGNNTYDYANAASGAHNTYGAKKDEDQVMLVVAHYKMNQ